MNHPYRLSRFAMLGTLLAGTAGTSIGCWGKAHTDCDDGIGCATSTGDTSGNAGASAGGSTNGGNAGHGGTAGNGESGAAGSGVVPCDTTKAPTEEACLVGNQYAVFVAPTGDDNAAGTTAAPLATLTKAITLADGKKFVIVCDATYDEHVVVGGGAHVYGGFSCTGGSWKTEVGAPLFKPSDAGPALKIDTVTDAVLLDSVNFEVPDATVAGGTALTALVNASTSVTLQKVSLTAGSGMNGTDGTLTPFNFPEQTSLNGNAENLTDATHNGTEKDCTCQATLMSVGGLGGAPAGAGQSGSQGLPDNGGGQPGTPGSCATTGTGRDGLDASVGPPAHGAASLGALSALGWTPTSGTDGATGSPGQGGGGGASRNNAGHGGGGGCGGCGGNGAKAGQGGGASIALLALDSPITLEGCSLTTKDAGSGGAGAMGQPGQQDVGGGGIGLNPLNSCSGGNGGKGGAGGASGGGAGGISVGVVWKGAVAPTLTDTTTTTGKAGGKGIGGVSGTNDGIDGVKKDVLNVP